MKNKSEKNRDVTGGKKPAGRLLLKPIEIFQLR